MKLTLDYVHPYTGLETCVATNHVEITDQQSLSTINDLDFLNNIENLVKTSFRPNKVICCLPSITMKEQITEIQNAIEKFIPQIRGRVSENKLHVTLIAYNSNHNLEAETNDILRRTVELNLDIKFEQLKIYSGHVVITIKCERALHISEELLEIATDEGIDHDPTQSLHVTIFRNVRRRGGGRGGGGIWGKIRKFAQNRRLQGHSRIWC